MVGVIICQLVVYICSYLVPSQPPRQIRVQNISATAAYLVWTPPEPWNQNGPIVSYSVAYSIRTRSTSDLTNLKLNSSTESYTDFQLIVSFPRVDLCHLLPETVYAVSISAMTEVGKGPYSLPLTFQTNRSGMSVWVYDNLYVCSMHVEYLYLYVYISMYVKYTENCFNLMACWRECPD